MQDWSWFSALVSSSTGLITCILGLVPSHFFFPGQKCSVLNHDARAHFSSSRNSIHSFNKHFSSTCSTWGTVPGIWDTPAWSFESAVGGDGPSTTHVLSQPGGRQKVINAMKNRKRRAEVRNKLVQVVVLNKVAGTPQKSRLDWTETERKWGLSHSRYLDISQGKAFPADGTRSQALR